jgi:hypothetical protein
MLLKILLARHTGIISAGIVSDLTVWIDVFLSVYRKPMKKGIIFLKDALLFVLNKGMICKEKFCNKPQEIKH